MFALNETLVYCSEIQFSEQYHLIPILRSYITDTERKKSIEYKTELLQHNFIITRALLRLFLAQKLNLPPLSISFLYEQYGKPYIPNQNLCFNLSHTKEKLFIALTVNNPIGVDIETIEPAILSNFDLDFLFNAIEKQHYQRLQRQEQIMFFFQTWVIKEAFSKAQGTGLHLSFNEVNIQFLPFSTEAFTVKHNNGLSEIYYGRVRNQDVLVQQAIVSRYPIDKRVDFSLDLESLISNLKTDIKN